jgi:hypothetical protein
MIELRLCSIEGARWLERLIGQTEVRAPTGLGLMFDRAIARRVQQHQTVDAFLNTEDCIVLALSGVPFQSPELIVSAAHALGMAAVLGGIESNIADTIDAFVRGRDPYSAVPSPLADAGVYSCLTHKESLEFGRWIGKINRSVYAEQVSDTVNPESVDAYLAVAQDLEGIFNSVRIHGCDVCCWRLLAEVQPESGRDRQ